MTKITKNRQKVNSSKKAVAIAVVFAFDFNKITKYI